MLFLDPQSRQQLSPKHEMDTCGEVAVFTANKSLMAKEGAKYIPSSFYAIIIFRISWYKI